ncbi:MAG TPA: site-2 protease family protein [Polyangiaceae bacterium]|nr:site-2 protease family protein [Polyangiaceae bacterium]
MVSAWRRLVGSPRLCVALCGVLLFAFKVTPLYVISWFAVSLNALALLVAVPLSTVVHEAAHAFVAHSIGLCVLRVRLGYGPIIWSRYIGFTSVEIRRIPLTGDVWVAAPSTRWLRARLMATAAAGPLSNAVVLAASVWRLCNASAAPDATVRPVPALVLAVVNAVLFVKNAVPLPRRTEPPEERMESTDGWQALAAPFRDPRYLRNLVSTYVAWKVPHLLLLGRCSEAGELVAVGLQNDPESRGVRWAYASLMLDGQCWSAAGEELRHLVDESTPEATLILANDLAWAYVMQDDPALLEEADRLSSRVFGRAPNDPLVHRTRGAVLLARGCLEHAQELLTFAFENDPRRYKAVTACLLTMLHARKGDGAEAQTWLEKARYWNPECYLLSRAEAGLTGSE